MRLIITGGGTGGHLFPGIALAEGLRHRDPETAILFIGTDRQIDQLALGGMGLDRTVIRCSGLKGKGLLHRFQAIAQLPLAVWQAAAIIRRFRPDIVFGVGGYVTGPVLAAAKLLGIPICLHEQNSVPGLANRLAGRFADRVFISLPCTPEFPEERTIRTGNPVRAEILHAAEAGHRKDDAVPTVLVLGGSQGAHRVNLLMAAAMKKLADRAVKGIKVIHQTGREDEHFIRQTYEAVGIPAEVQAFFSDMAAIYLKADLVVSRAGATTLAELAVLGLPALLIPYPHAADNHQMTNARYYAVGGGARVLVESDLSGDKLADHIEGLLHNRQELHTMAANMKEMGLPQATDRIVESCLELLA